MIPMDEHRKRRNEISIIPLINVVFLLLIFFMVNGTLERKSDVVDLPTSHTAAELKEQTPYVITIKRRQILFNDEPIKPTDLKRKLRPLVAGKTEEKRPAIVLQAASNLPGELLVNVLKLVTNYGISQVMVATSDDKKDEQ